jgi:rod shape-determining protein MreC
MRNILALIQRYYVFLMFVGLQIFALVLLFQSNNFHRSEFVRHSSDWVGSIYGKRDQFSRYLRLGEINDQLALENAMLRSLLPENVSHVDTASFTQDDTLSYVKYTFKNAKVINATINRERNYLTLDLGRLGGIKQEWGVIANGSLVGIVSSVSEHYSVVMPVLHSKFLGSVKMKGSGDFGLLAWPGGDPMIADVKEIPKHVNVQVGDTVVTTGYASHFPADLLVGFVESLDDRAEDNFHRIKVKLSTDFRKLNYVQVVSNILKEEQDSLEQQVDLPDHATDHP